MIRVLLADDQPLVRTGLRMILSAEPDLDIVGEACDGAEAISLCASARPDVVLMDVRMPGIDGIEATRTITTSQDPAPRVLVLTTFDLDDVAYDALRAGASGFLLKDASEEDASEDRLITAIRVVSDGGSLFAPSVTRRLIEEFSRRDHPREYPSLAGLTDREVDVLRQMARGLSNSEIAATLFVTENTVKTHVARVLRRARTPRPGAGGRGGLRIRSRHTHRRARCVNSPCEGASRSDAAMRCRWWSGHRGLALPVNRAAFVRRSMARLSKSAAGSDCSLR